MEKPTITAAPTTESQAAVKVEFDPERRLLLLAFGGLAAQLGFTFEFKNISARFEAVNKIYLRDAQRQWYHGGVEGVGKDIAGVVDFLRAYTTHPATRRCVAFGNSGGGYAALLFGHLLAVDEVHAISPQTQLDPIVRALRRQVGMWRPLIRLLLNARAEPEYFDLKRLLDRQPNGRTRFHIYYSADSRRDRHPALRMRGVPSVELHPYVHSGHNLVAVLKRQGELERIMDGALRSED